MLWNRNFICLIGLYAILFFVTLSCSNKEIYGKWEKIHDIKVRYDAAAGYFINEKFGVIVNADRMFFTENGGKNWKKSDTRFGYNGFDILDQNEGFIYSSALPNGNKTGNKLAWNQIRSSFYNEFALVSFATKDSGWLASNSIRPKLRKTGDAGKSWSEVAVPAEMRAILALCLVNENSGYILDYDFKIFKTADNGVTWETIPLNFNKYDYSHTSAEPFRTAMRFYDDKNGEIVIYKVKPVKTWVNLETNDGGRTWNSITLPGDRGMACITHDGKYLTILGSDLIVLKRK